MIPVFLKNESNAYILNTKNIFIIYSLKNKKIIQIINPPDKGDRIRSIELNHDFNNINLLKIYSELEIFTTAPIGYKFNKFFILNDDGSIGDLFFSYFEQIGIQDEPFAELKNLDINDNEINLKYYYYNQIGYPEEGNGLIYIKYKIIDNKVILDTINHDIKKETGNIDENGNALLKKLKLNEKILNNNFKWCSYHKFIYKHK